MTELTKKKVDWLWSTDCDKAFQELKLKLSTAPVLAIPDPTAPFELITDSCGFSIGAALMQNSRPVAFYSRKMTDPVECHLRCPPRLILTKAMSTMSHRCLGGISMLPAR